MTFVMVCCLKEGLKGSRGDPEAFYYLTVLLHLKNAFGLSKNAELKVQGALIKMG